MAGLLQFDIDKFDKLEMYALALGHAHALWMGASTPSQSLEELLERGGALRLMMVVDATALAQRHLINGQNLKDLKGANGFRNLAFDLLTLAAVLRDAWSHVAGKTAVSLEELDQAENLADQLLTAVGVREQGPAGWRRRPIFAIGLFRSFYRLTTTRAAGSATCAGTTATWIRWFAGAPPIM
jgi:hypothetical protein